MHGHGATPELTNSEAATSDQATEALRTSVAPPGRCRGTDGKTYPQRWLSLEDRTFLISRVHYLSHDEDLSVRQIIATLAEVHGVRRSVGWVAGILRDYSCDHCPVQVREMTNLNTQGGGA